LADGRDIVTVRELRLQGIRDSRNSFPGNQETIDTVVSGNLVDRVQSHFAVAEASCQ